jgi:1-acyl-sn-glycerol-3-phosphate acyltransferase
LAICYHLGVNRWFFQGQGLAASSSGVEIPLPAYSLNPGVVRLSTMGCSLVAHFCADFKGMQNLPPPPYVLLPKHQSMLDIILEGVLIFRTQHVFAHYFMKHTLPDWLGLYGGIHVVRQRDAAPTSDRRRNVAALRRAQQVLAEKGVLVLHPEGTRLRGAIGRLQAAGLTMIVGWQKDLGRIPLVPVGIRYDRQVHVRVGVPRIYTSIGTAELQELRGDLGRLCEMGFCDAPEQSNEPSTQE